MNATQTLFQCLKNLNPGWTQKDIAAALYKTPGRISQLAQGKRELEKDTAALARKLVADRVAELTGDQYSYRQVQRIARYYEEMTGGASAPPPNGPEDDSVSLEYKIALMLSQRGVAIVS